MDRFNQPSDIRQYVSDRMPFDIESYGKTHDELLQYATFEFMGFLEERGCKYGDELKAELLEELDKDDCALWWSFFN